MARNSRIVAVVGLLAGGLLTGCSSTSSGSHRPDPEAVPCTVVSVASESRPQTTFTGVRGCTGTVVTCDLPQVDSGTSATVTATVTFDGKPIGTTTVAPAEAGFLPFQIPFSLQAQDGPHQLGRTCSQPSASKPVSYSFTLVTERLAVSPTSTTIGDTVALSATGLNCVVPHTDRPVGVVFEWDDAPSGTDVRLATVPAPAAYGSIPSFGVTVPENAQTTSTLSLRCQFDPAGSRRATAAVQVASPYSLTLSPLNLTVGGQETVTVKGLTCAGGSQATGVVLDEGVKVAEFPAPDAGTHQAKFTVDRTGTHHVGVRCAWQTTVRPDLTGTFTAGPPPVVQTLNRSGGPVGIDFAYTVSGVTCPSGTPLQLVWDGKLVLDSVAGATSVTKVYAFQPDRQRVPQAADGNHTIGVRCGDNGQPLGEPQAFTVTSQPNLTVDPPRALPDDPIPAKTTGFNCINPTPGYNNAVVYLLDGIPLAQPPVVPHTMAAGKHTLVAQCDWPKIDAAHQRSRAFWVPGITLTPTQGLPTVDVTVDLAGFDCPTATVYFGGSVAAIVAIGGSGTGTATMKPPADLVAGAVPVTADCPNSRVQPGATYQLLALEQRATSSPRAGGPDTGSPFWPEVLGAVLALILVAIGGLYLTLRRGRGPRGPRGGRPPGLHIQLELGLPRLQVRERR